MLQRSVAASGQVEESPFGGCVRVLLGGKIDGNGIGGRIFGKLIMANVFHTRGARPDRARARASDDFTSGAFRRRTGIMLF